MTTNVLEFTTEYQLNKYNLFENSNWIVSLRPEQKTPFSMIISIKSNKYKLSTLTPVEIIELHDCYKFIENLCFNKLKATKINYLCLMMIDSIIHFHVFPRFKDKLLVEDVYYKDIYYPKPVDLLDKQSLNIDSIFKFIK